MKENEDALFRAALEYAATVSKPRFQISQAELDRAGEKMRRAAIEYARKTKGR